MNLIIWNCRGVSSKGFVAMVKDLSLRYQSNFVCLLETHVGGSRVGKIVKMALQISLLWMV